MSCRLYPGWPRRTFTSRVPFGHGPRRDYGYHVRLGVAGATLADASRRMIDVDTAAVVIDNEALVGMIPERDLLRVFRDGGSPD